VNRLRLAAWVVFGLDLVLLTLMAHDLLTARAGPTGQALMLAFTTTMAALVGVVAIVLALGTWLRSRLVLWLGLVIGALPLLWVVSVIAQNLASDRRMG
jgi:formate/nitrite transporter FocA (FNT family)